jgi:hypothetical protein
MSLPTLDSSVILRVPDREALSARVERVGSGWLDVELRYPPRTPMAVLERHAVFLEYVEPAGLVRIMGHVQPTPGLPVHANTLRFTHREVVQLLRRREHAGGRVRAPITLVAALPGAVAHPTELVAVGASQIVVADLPGAIEGDAYEFSIQPGGNEPAVAGRAQVEHIADGHVVLAFVMVAEFERERLARLFAGMGG